MTDLAVIDIGSNSIRMVLYELGAKGTFRVRNDIKESVRLEEGMDESGCISNTKIVQALKTMLMFKRICEAIECDEIIAVGTEVLRSASNNQVLIDRVRQETGIEIRVLSGEEEAYYDYIGVVHSMELGEALLMDIGGGSTELVRVRKGILQESISLPYGAINLTAKFDLDGKLETDKEKKMKSFFKELYGSVPWLDKARNYELVGIGGSLRCMAKIDRRRKDYPLDIVHHYSMRGKEVKEVFDTVKSKNYGQRLKIKGLDVDRADIILAPIASVTELINYCNVDNVTISGNGLREGLVYDYIYRTGIWQRGSNIENPLDLSIRNVLITNQLNDIHAQNVYRLSRNMYSCLQPLHHLDAAHEKILKTAAMLHDSGVSIRYYNHARHSFYMVLNSGLNGITHRELLMSAYIAAAHYKEGLKPEFNRYSKLLNDQDWDSISKIGVMVRIAEGLDRSMSGFVHGVSCEIEDSQVVLHTMAQGFPELEIRDAMRAAPQFQRVYGKALTII